MYLVRYSALKLRNMIVSWFGDQEVSTRLKMSLED